MIQPIDGISYNPQTKAYKSYISNIIQSEIDKDKIIHTISKKDTRIRRDLKKDKKSKNLHE